MWPHIGSFSSNYLYANKWVHNFLFKVGQHYQKWHIMVILEVSVGHTFRHGYTICFSTIPILVLVLEHQQYWYWYQHRWSRAIDIDTNTWEIKPPPATTEPLPILLYRWKHYYQFGFMKKTSTETVNYFNNRNTIEIPQPILASWIWSKPLIR